MAGAALYRAGDAKEGAENDVMEKPLAKLILKKGEGRLLKRGGLRVYDNEAAGVEGEFVNGDLVRVLDFDGYPMGTGVINEKSRIRVRMLTRDPAEEIDDAFFEKRVRSAWMYRRKTVDTGSCRVIFGEADGLPGITVDKYEDVLVIESLSLGTDRFKERILQALVRVLGEDGIAVRGIVERSDAKERLKEGMERVKGFLSAPFDPEVVITENGVRFIVDVMNGQKTGFFLDQKYNRRAIRPMAADAEVLDCFTHTGSFALNAAAAGARQVTAVDASAYSLETAKRNAALNGFTQIRFLEADVMELLPRLRREGQQYDLVILDPPAFAKSKEHLKNAEKGYRELNRNGILMVRPGGFLATCSCSHFMGRELFEKMIREAAGQAHRRLRLVEARNQSPDHPVLLAAEETYYLKFYIFQVMEG